MEFLKLFSGRNLAWQSVVETVVEDRMIWSFFRPEWDMDLFLSLNPKSFPKDQVVPTTVHFKCRFVPRNQRRVWFSDEWRWRKNITFLFFSGHVFDICFVIFFRNRIGLDIIDIFQWCFSTAYFWKKLGYNLHRMNMWKSQVSTFAGTAISGHYDIPMTFYSRSPVVEIHICVFSLDLVYARLPSVFLFTVMSVLFILGTQEKPG